MRFFLQSEMIIYRFIYCIQLEGCLDRSWDLLAAVSVSTSIRHEHDVTQTRSMICSDLVFNYIATRRWADAHQQHCGVWAASADRCFTDPEITCHYHHLISPQTVLHCPLIVAIRYGYDGETYAFPVLLILFTDTSLVSVMM